jgi:hypothetical protein
MPLPSTEPEISAFLHAFEQCTLPKAEWTHSAHLLIGACYVHTLGESEAIAAMRTNVSRFNESVGGRNTDTSGYHETITVAWIKLLAALLAQAQPITRESFANMAVAHFAPRRDLFARHYDFDLLQSTPARLRWIEPNLAPLETSALID